MFALLLVGCLTGNSYPDRYAEAFCSALFTCVPADDIDFWAGYDDETECRADIADGIRESADYEGWEEGDCAFDKEAAQACIDEVAQVETDPDCDGEMTAVEFAVDATDDICIEVYDC